MWVIDNIIRGLFIMMKVTLLGYALIHLFFMLRALFKKD